MNMNWVKSHFFEKRMNIVLIRFSIFRGKNEYETGNLFNYIWGLIFLSLKKLTMWDTRWI